MAERCKEKVQIVNDVEIQTMDDCGRPAHAYRQCGRGCKHIEAFCEAHGGDDKAQTMMRKHHEVAHG